jgi:hypothetical protein
MDDKKNNIDEIDKYYSSIDKGLINNLCQNNNLKNLINLSTQTDIYIFNKKNKKWQLKSKDKLLKECEQIKKKELKVSSSMLSNLAKLSNIDDSNTVKTICQNLENKILNIDKIMSCINNLETQINKTPNSDNYIGSIEPIKQTQPINPNKYKPNIVSFDEIIISKPKPNSMSTPKQKYNSTTNESNKVIDLNISQEFKSSSSSDNYIECYGNC